jgi:cytochrome c553
MNKLIVSLLLTLGITGVAHAAGDATAGQTKAAVCGACHGADGNSPLPNFPKLAGQGEKYLTKQMHDIKDGKRTVLEMTGMLTNLNDQDLSDIAAYFASQAGSVGAADPKLVERGEKLFRGGDLLTKACRPAPAATLRMARVTPQQASRTWVASTPSTSPSN